MSIFAIPIVLVTALFKTGMRIRNYFHRKNNAPDPPNQSLIETTKQIINSSSTQFKIHWAVTTIFPALYIVVSILLCLRVYAGIGHWPQYRIGAPGTLLADDSIYSFLYDTIRIVTALAGWSVFLWIGFFMAWYDKYSILQRKILLWTFILVWIIVIVTTGNTFGWLYL